MNYLLNRHRSAGIIQRWLSRAIDYLTVTLYRAYKQRSIPAYFPPPDPTPPLPTMSDAVGIPTYAPSPYDETPMAIYPDMPLPVQ